MRRPTMAVGEGLNQQNCPVVKDNRVSLEGGKRYYCGGRQLRDGKKHPQTGRKKSLLPRCCCCLNLEHLF